MNSPQTGPTLPEISLRPRRTQVGRLEPESLQHHVNVESFCFFMLQVYVPLGSIVTFISWWSRACTPVVFRKRPKLTWRRTIPRQKCPVASRSLFSLPGDL